MANYKFHSASVRECRNMSTVFCIPVAGDKELKFIIAHLPVSSWSSSSALVNRAAERQGHAVDAAITVMVFDVAAFYCRRPGFSSHCGTSLERSACGRYLVEHSASFLATAQD